MGASTRLVMVVLVLFGFAACGDDGGSSTPAGPTTPTTPAPSAAPANRAPVISSVSVSPTFGVSQLTSFSYSVSASDADGDSLSYQWDIAGTSRSGSSGSITMSGDGTIAFRVTVTDGRGGSTVDSRAVTVGSMTGKWIGTGAWIGAFTMQLAQNAGAVTGSYSDAEGPGGIPADQPGSINATGVIEMRIKQAPYGDWYFRGQMDSTGRRITGTMHGSGFDGDPFSMDKQ